MNPPHEPIAAYLARLRTVSRELPPDIADELIADVRGHLEEVEAVDASAAAIRQAMDDLGTPEQIVAAARSELVLADGGPPGADQPSASPLTEHGPDVTRAGPPGGQATPVEAFTLLLVLVGPVLALVVVRALTAVTNTPLMLAFVVLVGVAIASAGTALLWTRPIWSTNEKILATLVWPGGLLAPLALALLPGQTCITEAGSTETICTGFALPMPLGLLLLITLLVAPVVVAVKLLQRAGRRRATTHDGASGQIER